MKESSCWGTVFKMNYLAAEKLIDLQYLVSLDIELVDKSVLTSREIWKSTWHTSLVNELVKKVTLGDLKKFVRQLVLRRKQQVADLHHEPGAVFYLWYDEQDLALCYNILSGKDRELPFYCDQVVTLDSPDSILKRYLKEAKECVVKMEELEKEEDGEWGIDSIRSVDAAEFGDEKEPEYTAYVYVERFD